MDGVLYRVSNKDDGNLSEAWGTSEEVSANRDAFYKKLDIQETGVVLIQTEHKDAIVRVGKEKGGTTVACEALMTNEPGVVLALLTADCFPVSFYDPKHGAIALAHCGWRPIGLSLPKKVIAALIESFGTNPADVIVQVGPGIHPESYVVSDVAQANDAAWTPYLTPLPDGSMRVDLYRYLCTQLCEAGVLDRHIELDPIDTAAAPEYFSHYRSQRTNEPEGRFMTVLSLGE